MIYCNIFVSAHLSVHPTVHARNCEVAKVTNKDGRAYSCCVFVYLHVARLKIIAISEARSVSELWTLDLV